MPLTKHLILLAAAVIFMVGVLFVILFATSRSPARPPLPNPNGYDDLLKAAGLLRGDIAKAPGLDRQALEALISTNAEALRVLRLGFSRPCVVPADLILTNISGAVADLGGLRSLARLLVEEGRLAEMEGRNMKAARSYVDAIRLGNEIGRGGLLIYSLVGISCEAMGQVPLSKLVSRLKSEEIRSLLADLDKIESTRISWNAIKQAEYKFARSQIIKGFNPITLVMAMWQNRAALKKAELRYHRIVAHARLLTLELALRSYRAEEGRGPERLEQLVPKYLQSVPLDPFSNRPLQYRLQGTNWLPYSVGEDRTDNGGTRATASVAGSVAKEDLFYDSPH